MSKPAEGAQKRGTGADPGLIRGFATSSKVAGDNREEKRDTKNLELPSHQSQADDRGDEGRPQKDETKKATPRKRKRDTNDEKSRKRSICIQQRDPLESDMIYSFRILRYLEKKNVIVKAQNASCRRILSEETARGLTAALMEYAVEKDESVVKKAICDIVPPPLHPAAEMAKDMAGHAKRFAVHSAIGYFFKGISYAAVAAGTAFYMKIHS